MIQNYYAFLSEMPRDILSTIDLGVLHHPSAGENELISQLSADMEKYVVIYKSDHVTTGVHLCRVLKPALLSSAQLATLTSVEKTFPSGHVLVAYEKPLVMTDLYQLN
jgi:hypothetical protein